MKSLKKIFAGILSVSLMLSATEITSATESFKMDVSSNDISLECAEEIEDVMEESLKTTVDEAYLISYHVGEWSLQTDTDGNVYAIIDGVNYPYGEQCDISVPEGYFDMENQNLVYELHNDEIVEIYTMAEVMGLKVVAEPDIEDGLKYQNGKFSQEKFGLVLKVSNNLQDYFKEMGLLLNLSSAEKERLYLPVKDLSIESSDGVNFV